MEENKFTNKLAEETSPYLLQHAHNPVNWYPWGEEALNKAKAENKPILVSVGYSACHWGHVMEHESFEDTAVASIMNKNFICIKVDREERPDIDQIYMDAVQLMTRQGGWPLNCFALPDGRPFYGGTYFPKEKWIGILTQLADIYQNQPEKVEEYAQNLTFGLSEIDFISPNEKKDFQSDILPNAIEKWSSSFDNKDGGPNRAPKFPSPNSYDFLLNYGSSNNNSEILNHVNLTLTRMGQRGIYDQIGGGFSRYSTDIYWKVPHFEKMLYDNAQLISLYSKAFVENKNPHYKLIIEETIAFCKNELSIHKGFYFSALDADSEGIEGKYYVWKLNELKNALDQDFEFFEQVYHINEFGLWEDGNYIIMEKENQQEIAAKLNINITEFNGKKKELKSLLHEIRKTRIKPGLDDKTLTSWNALMLIAYNDAYKALLNDEYKLEAEKIANFILSQQRMDDGGLFHNYKNGKSNIIGYLEDYCFTIEGLIGLYEITFNESYLKEAKTLTNYCLDNFYDDASGFFFFTSATAEKLITRKKELTDDVIPGSNSSMAKALFKLALFFDNPKYNEISKKMALSMVDNVKSYPTAYANWQILIGFHSQPFFEIASSGPHAIEKIRNIYSSKLVNNAIFMASEKQQTQLPLLKGKFIEEEASIFVCVNKTCKLPVKHAEQAIKQIESYN